MKKSLIALALGFGLSVSAMAQDIVDVAVKAGSFKTLVAAVQAAGLVDTLKGPGLCQDSKSHTGCFTQRQSRSDQNLDVPRRARQSDGQRCEGRHGENRARSRNHPQNRWRCDGRWRESGGS
jgi:hypothetical protein